MAKPIMMPKPTSNGHYRAVRGQHGYAVFLNSRGELTAYNAHGRRMWSAQTGATWLNHASDRPSERVSPTLLPLALHRGAVPSAIVVAGAHRPASVCCRPECASVCCRLPPQLCASHEAPPRGCLSPHHLLCAALAQVLQP